MLARSALTKLDGRQARLRQHEKAIHDKLKDLQCEFCNFSTSYPAAFMQHVRAVHEKVKYLSCGQCSFRTAHFKNLGRQACDIGSRENSG